jgi:hypothetical protein
LTVVVDRLTGSSSTPRAPLLLLLVVCTRCYRLLVLLLVVVVHPPLLVKLLVKLLHVHIRQQVVGRAHAAGREAPLLHIHVATCSSHPLAATTTTE